MARLHAKIGTFRQLEILLAVYHEGSITGASKALFLTQPTVSMQLKKLSDAVGAPLYDQVGRKLIFTDAGLEVVSAAREILSRLEHLEMKLNDLQGLKTGTLRLAVVNTAQYFIPHLLGEFLHHYPNVDVEFSVGNRQQVIDRLNAAEDDFYVFSHPPQDRDLALHEFLPNPLVAIVPQQNPLAKLKSVTLENFMEQPFLIREQGSGTRFAVEKHLNDAGVEPKVKMTVASNEAIKHAVMSGLGVTILSSHTLAFGGNTGLAKLTVEGLPIKTQWYLASLKSKQPSLLAQTFLRFVSEFGRDSMLAQMNL